MVKPETAGQRKGILGGARAAADGAYFAVQDAVQSAGRALAAGLSGVGLWLQSMWLWMLHSAAAAWQVVRGLLLAALSAVVGAWRSFAEWGRGVCTALGIPTWVGGGGGALAITAPIVFRKLFLTGIKFAFRQFLKRFFGGEG